jgi:hypothetical protein
MVVPNSAPIHSALCMVLPVFFGLQSPWTCDNNYIFKKHVIMRAFDPENHALALAGRFVVYYLPLRARAFNSPVYTPGLYTSPCL